jgi:hypothetical protein
MSIFQCSRTDKLSIPGITEEFKHQQGSETGEL